MTAGKAADFIAKGIPLENYVIYGDVIIDPAATSAVVVRDSVIKGGMIKKTENYADPVVYDFPITIVNTHIEGKAGFSGAVFNRDFRIEGTSIISEKPAGFSIIGVRFNGNFVLYHDTLNVESVKFNHTEFRRNAIFDGVFVNGRVEFTDTIFHHDASFMNMNVAEHADFSGASFLGAKYFDN